jgi:RNA polymerase sigma factor (sigma-70 family)
MQRVLVYPTTVRRVREVGSAAPLRPHDLGTKPQLLANLFTECSHHRNPRIMEREPPRYTGRGGSVEDSDGLRQALVSREGWAEREVFEQYLVFVHTLMGRCVGPVLNLDELVQEVFLQVFAHFASRRQGAPLRAVIYGAVGRVARVAVTWRRWGKRRLAIRTSPLFAVATADAGAEQSTAQIRRILDGMKPKHRLAFVFHHLEGLSLRDTAQALGVSLAAAHRWVRAARRHIDRELGRAACWITFLEGERPER